MYEYIYTYIHICTYMHMYICMYMHALVLLPHATPPRAHASHDTAAPRLTAAMYRYKI